MNACPRSIARCLPHVTFFEMDSLSDCAIAPYMVIKNSLSGGSELIFSFSNMTAIPRFRKILV